MATANEELYDRLISHSIWLERYKSGVVRQFLEELNASNDDTEEQLGRRLATIVRNGGYDAGMETRARIDELLRMLAGIRGEAYGAAVGFLTSEIKRLAHYEAEWQVATLNKVIPIDLVVAEPTTEVLEAAVFSRPFQGHLLKEWADGMAPADLDRLERAIKTGILDGQASEEIVRNIVGTRANGYADGLLEVSRRSAEAVTRTAINHVTSQARSAVYRANADIISEERWTSTLDGRTTLVCIGRDGKTFAVGEGPRPPAHWRCRSLMVPVLDGVKLVGTRPVVTDTRTRQHREVDFRAEAKAAAGDRWKGMDASQRQRAIAKRRAEWTSRNIGGIPKETTYAQWLARQPASFQDDVLGPTRAKLFRAGGLPLDKFTDRAGHDFTLEQLRAREAEAFERAGL